ncbi:DUF4982 domain-containing protein [Qipengyuania flava]|nr:DUF4982 domain-containing protein [Qipengyuania flava]
MRSTLMILLLAGIACPGVAAPPQSTETEIVSPAPRALTVLTDGWVFKQGDLVGDPSSPSFDDSAWEDVTIPHTWNRVGYYKPDPQAHIHRPETIDKSQGVGWYRLEFRTPPHASEKRVWLEFDAASRVASVWVNGKKLGEHRGGFSRFRFDATEALDASGVNVLTVRTDNSPPDGQTEATADVLPLAGDFFVHGGLYRPVRLVVVDPVHIDLSDYGSAGFSATTIAASDTEAKVAVVAKVANQSAKAARVQVSVRLIDIDGRAAAHSVNALSIGPNAKGDVETMLSVADPRLWQGTEDPHLYDLVIEVADHRGRVLDRIRKPFGIRTISIDPDKGLFLNGRHVTVRGVGYHQDREGKGWAVSAADTEQDVAILREMGVNAIRLSHYQHGQVIHDLADRYGLLLWDEIPLVSVWTRRGELVPRPALVENAAQQLRELIRQNRNHPSVVTWGIANEVDFGNSFPAFLTGFPEGQAPDPMPLLEMLQSVAQEEDASRPTVLATCCEGRLFDDGVDIPTTAAAADLGGANRYFGWYFGKPGDLGPHLDQLRALRPEQPLSVSEYGAGGATTIHTDDVLGGPIDSRGIRQPEEYLSYIHEEAWKAIDARPYLWATWLWNAFDFATTIRTEGDAQDINTKGLVTYDREIRKDAYYFYRANWSDAPTVHINGRRYVDRAYRVTDIRVYSNALETELTLNGRSLGSKRDCPQRICVWSDVTLSPGKNMVFARGDFSTGAIADEVSWSLSQDSALAFRIDSGAIVAAPAKVRYGSDAFFNGGSTGSLDQPADYGKPAVPATISGTEETAIAATYRSGQFEYTIPLTPGRYRVLLTFVEPAAGPGERIFDVRANGETIVKALDIARMAGGTGIAIKRSVEVSVPNDALTLGFEPSKGEAIVSAIEVIPADL